MQPKDTVQSWVVAACTTVLVFLETGVIKSLGVLLPDIRGDFATHTWVIGLSIAFTQGFASLACLVTGAMSKLWPPRYIICMCGVLSSLGLLIASHTTNVLVFMASFTLTGFLGGSVTVTVGILSSYFDKYYAIAAAMVTCGGSLGIIIFPPFTQFLLNMYGWRGAILIISGICFHAVICGALIKPIQCDYTVLPSTEALLQQPKTSLWKTIKRSLDCSLFSNFSFVSMIFIALGSGYYTTGWLIYAVPYARDIGFGPYKASGIAIAGGAGNLLGNLLFPFLRKFVSNRPQLYISQCVLSLSLALNVLASTLHSYIWMILCSVLFGVCRGVLAVVWYAILNDIIDEKQMVNAIGWTWAAYGISSVSSGFFSGWLYDQLQSYTASFLVLSMICFLGIIPTCVQDISQYILKDKVRPFISLPYSWK